MKSLSSEFDSMGWIAQRVVERHSESGPYWDPYLREDHRCRFFRDEVASPFVVGATVFSLLCEVTDEDS